ncbi:MAG: DUF3365 domain-containing protein [Proteobacteria bacterium]|nr:DUF3365 domain-containing protein [Pseudomonadota bacterium]MBU1686940.1 DUF3365 domain-containing protein [Pseudomonadota bacterium]
MQSKTPENNTSSFWRITSIGLLVTSIVAALLFMLTRQYVIHQAEKNIQNLMLSHRGIHQYIQRTMHPTFYGLRDRGEVPDTFYAPEIFSSSFIVRTQHRYYNEERKAAGLPELYYKMAATNPRNPVNMADPLEAKLIKYFNDHRDKKNYREIVKIDGTKYLYYAMPFLLTAERCLTCHGKREDAPLGLQALYPGEGGFNEKAGVYRAIESIRAPLEEEYTAVYIIVAALLSGFLVIQFLVFFNNRLHRKVAIRTKELEMENGERIKAEEALRQLNIELEDRVNERTIALAAANKELDSFAYSVSHDLRAPLRGIDGFSLALMEDYSDQLDNTAKDYLLRIKSGCTKMGLLIDDLLKMSRLSRGELNKEQLDLTSMAREISASYQAQHADHEIDFTIAPDMTATGDPTLVRAVLQNLIENACKFTSKKSEAKIHIGIDTTKSPRQYFIKDNGAGFNMEYADKLFTAFQRLHKATDFPGTGIGLATVQRIIHRHGGKIWAESKENAGATFFFTLTMEPQAKRTSAPNGEKNER